MSPTQQPLTQDDGEPIAPIKAAATTYVEARDARMVLTKQEVEAHDALLKLMAAHELEEYEVDGLVISVKKTEKVKVRRKKEDETLPLLPTSSGDEDGDGEDDGDGE